MAEKAGGRLARFGNYCESVVRSPTPSSGNGPTIMDSASALPLPISAMSDSRRLHHWSSDIAESTHIAAQRGGCGVTAALNVRQRHPVLVPPVLERRNELSPMRADVPVQNRLHVTAQDRQQQLGGAHRVEYINRRIEPTREPLLLGFDFLLQRSELLRPRPARRHQPQRPHQRPHRSSPP
jgi:hypothetical protein